MTTQPAFSLARRLGAGETVYSGWCGLPSPIVAELVGREGFPAVTLDGQPVQKGTIRFPIDTPPSATLVKKIVKARIKENEARWGP